MEKWKTQLRLLLISQISIWLEYGLDDVCWSACYRFLLQLKRELDAERGVIR